MPWSKPPAARAGGYADAVIRRDLPTPVRLIGWFQTAVGIVAIVSGLVVARGAAMVFVLSGAVSVAIGLGLLQGRVWAYYAALVLTSLNLASLVVLFFRGARGFFPALAVNALILYFLLAPDVRAWAASQRRPGPPVV